jgi:hypothetical protein
MVRHLNLICFAQVSTNTGRVYCTVHTSCISNYYSEVDIMFQMCSFAILCLVGSNVDLPQIKMQLRKQTGLITVLSRNVCSAVLRKILNIPKIVSNKSSTPKVSDRYIL